MTLGERVTRTIRRSRAAAALACLTLASTSLVGAAVARAETVTPAVSDCLNVDTEKTWEADAALTVVDCAESHNSQVFKTLAYPEGGAKPSVLKERIWDLFGGECNQGDMMGWLGAPRNTRLPLRVYTMPRIPTDVEWEAGARWVACTAARPAPSGDVANLTTGLPELFGSTPLQDWLNCAQGTPKSGKWTNWVPCTSKTKWLTIEGGQVKGKITGAYPKDLQAKGDAMCAKQAKPFLKKGAKTKPIAGLGPKSDFPDGDPFADCFIALADWNGKTG